MKVQCISTKCGYYTDLKLGKWYEVVVTDIPMPKDEWRIKFDGPYLQLTSYLHSYDKSLFRTVSERRDKKLKELGI
jgi:hypothetical protein